MSARAFGVTAGLDPGVATPLARRCEELGYASIWSNDHPGAAGLETLAAFAEGAERLELGVAVMGLRRPQPAGIGAKGDEVGLHPRRPWGGGWGGFSQRTPTPPPQSPPAACAA